MNYSEELEKLMDQIMEITSGYYKREGWEKGVEGTFLAFLFVVPFIANGTICTVLLQGRRLNSASKLLLLSLLTANLLLTLCNVPFAIISVILDRWVFGDVFCNLSGFLTNTLIAVSNFSVSAISLHRYYLVVKPLSAKISKVRARLLIAYVWFTAIVFSAPPLFGWNNYEYSNGKGFCSVRWRTGGAGLVYSVLIIAAVYLSPLVTMVYSYRTIYKATKAQRMLTESNTLKGLANGISKSQYQPTFFQSFRKALPCCPRLNADEHLHDRKPQACAVLAHSTSLTLPIDSSSCSHRGNTKETITKSRQNLRGNTKPNLAYEIKTIQNATLLISSFLLCFTPYYIVNLWSGFSQATPSHVTEFVTSWLYISTTAVNPLVYGYLNRHIKRAIRKLPLCKRICMFKGRDARGAGAVDNSRTFHDGPMSWAASNDGISTDY